jgi:hypothetical protein
MKTLGITTGGLLLGLTMGALAAYGWFELSDAKPVDFTFSLQCRSLESESGRLILPFATAMTVYEAGYREAEKDANAPSADSAAIWKQFETMYQKGYAVEYYHKDVLVAYNHGVPDGDAGQARVLGPWDTGTHIVEVTPNTIRVAGEWMPGAPVEGTFNRTSGHGEIFEYEPGEKPSLMSKVHKMFLLQCQPAKTMF